MPHLTRWRVGYALVLLALTAFLPFRFDPDPLLIPRIGRGVVAAAFRRPPVLRDVVLNAALFVPWGVLWALGPDAAAGRAGRWWRAVASAAVFAMGVEFLQLFNVHRVQSIVDVAVDAAGAGLGAAAALWGSGRHRRPAPPLPGPGAG